MFNKEIHKTKIRNETGEIKYQQIKSIRTINDVMETLMSNTRSVLHEMINIYKRSSLNLYKKYLK